MGTTAGHVAAFVVAFAGSVAMWAVYFNVGAERSSRILAASEDPGRLARSGYTYLHIIIVAGIIVSAVGDELVLHHPEGHDGHTDATTLAVILGGPALYLAGNSLFKRLSAPTSHLHTMAWVARAADPRRAGRRHLCLGRHDAGAIAVATGSGFRSAANPMIPTRSRL